MTEIHNHNQNHFDNACQTQVLSCGIKAHNKYTNICAGRGNYTIAEETLQKINETRKIIKDFFGLDNNWCVIFGYNTTQLINHFVATFTFKYGMSVIQDTAIMGHNSTFLQDKQHFHEEAVESVLVKTQYSNVDGQIILDNKNYIEPKIKIIDIAQGVFEHKDFEDNSIYIFSGHKAYSTHLGVAIVPKDILKFYDPLFVGGGMVEEVNNYSFKYSADEIKKWEAGLQNSASIICLGEVFKELVNINIKKQYKSLIIKYSRQIENIVKNKGFLIAKQNPNTTTTIISIYESMENIHFANKLSKYLADNGFHTRSGVLCADSYFYEKQIPPVCRISLGINNTDESVKNLINTINKF